jgi:hypothetical protein
MGETNPRDVARQGDIEVEPAGSRLDKFKAKPRAAGEPAVAKPRRQKQQRDFIMVTRAQFDRLSQAKCTTTERVFLHLLFLTVQKRGEHVLHSKPVTMANAALERIGVDRFAKRRALLELEALGLITMEWRGKKSPIATVLEG